MKSIHSLFLLAFSLIPFISWDTFDKYWITEKHKGYNFWYTSIDRKHTEEYNQLAESGINSVKSFFGSTFSKEFDIVIHPNRHSLDSSWQKDWKMPDFKSECWMVAHSVATKLDMISPAIWDKETCEHKYGEATKTRQLIAHEVFHVYHGQQNSSPDFSSTEGIDWFVEGLATYASGQCDLSGISEIKDAISRNTIPNGLDDFWTGKMRYGLSGSVVMYIDKTYGRSKLKELLPLSKKSEIFILLKTSEPELLAGWKKYMQGLMPAAGPGSKE